jgi:hypothetical protein
MCNYAITHLPLSYFRLPPPPKEPSLMVPGGWGSQIWRQSAHKGRKAVSPTHRAAVAPQKVFLVLVLVRGLVDPTAMLWPEGLCQWKIPVTPSGIESTTFQLVAQCLNQLRNRMPPTSCSNQSLVPTCQTKPRHLPEDRNIVHQILSSTKNVKSIKTTRTCFVWSKFYGTLTEYRPEPGFQTHCFCTENFR